MNAQAAMEIAANQSGYSCELIYDCWLKHIARRTSVCYCFCCVAFVEHF